MIIILTIKIFYCKLANLKKLFEFRNITLIL